MKQGFILPTPVEIIREAAGCFGIRNTKATKFLDEKAKEAVLHPAQISELINSVFYEGLAKSDLNGFAEFTRQAIYNIINTYCRKMAGCGFFIGSSRGRALVTINRHFFAIQLEPLLKKVLDPYRRYHAPSALDLLSSHSAFDQVWQWCSDTFLDWKKFEEATKEDKDKIRNWRSGKHFPDYQRLNAIIPQGSQSYILPLLLVARFIDVLKKKSWGKRLIKGAIDIHVSGSFDLQANMNRHPNRYFSAFTSFRKELSALEKILVKRYKTLDDFEFAAKQLQVCKNIPASLIPSGGEGLLNWFEARFLVLSGHLAPAKELYEKAFDALLCCGGAYIEQVVNESLVVTSAAENPDNVFFKKLKTAQVLYGYDIPSAAVESGQKQLRFKDTVEKWEVDMWRKGFDQMFIPRTLFPGVSYPFTDKYGPLMLDLNSEFKPDLRYSDKKINVGRTWQRRMPQINYFIMVDDLSSVNQLLQQCADVNVCSEVGDTPLLLSLHKLDLLEVPYMSLDRRYYDAIIKTPMTPDTVNQKTLKQKHLALIQAVRTGKLEIVRKILELGADVGKRGLADNQTALNEIIKLVGIKKNPERFREIMLQHPITPELIDVGRRLSAGDFGFSLSDLQAQLSEHRKTQFYKEISEMMADLMIDRVCKHTNIEELRDISRLLIRQGSDVNAEHNSPVKGYTPLMLAAELDEGELYSLMLEYGGKPHKTFIDPNTKTANNSWQIATFWRSRSILALRH
ncbi:hypothetical protein [Rheinheimera sp.]|uniref:hypothetical protein n=1 Tax=Rheinheimera sp. TaxID=1869214 RepID=UPI00273284EF|nr:hypothetical protein [Rheinheimera sp.]MDP2716717.1 hypothetical protein [Rheinheimera sp.]